MVVAYLAHPFHQRETGRIWQKYMETMYPHIEILNPFYDGPEQKHVEAVDSGKITDPYKLKFDGDDYMSADDMVNSDKGLIKRANIFIALLDDGTFGTAIELGIAHSWNKPIYICALRVAPQKLQNHPWSKSLAKHKKTFKGLEELEKQLIADYPCVQCGTGLVRPFV